MRLGYFARADNGGLGIESQEFVKHMKPDKILCIRGEHGHHPERFEGMNTQYTDGIPSHNELDQFLRGIDVVFSIESYYNWGALAMAKERGIKSVLRLNYEMDLAQTTDDFPHPDLYIAPSMWNFDKMPEPKKYLPFPVNRDVCVFKKRKKIENFYHIAGHQCHEDRNGTEILLDALPYINAPIKIFTQHPLGREIGQSNVEVISQDFDNYWEIHQGDCLVLPRRYGGQSLSMNEALSCGIPTLMPRISPQDAFLPADMLVDTSGHRMIDVQGGKVDCYDTDEQKLAERINFLYNMPITLLSEWADRYADTISWKTLKPEYIKTFEELVK